jgi:formamidopyrimidine-DNA glycosylase
LGFDRLWDLPGPREFRKALKERRRAFKALLLDQGFAAGVGNWVADEAHFAARLDPRRPADSLDQTEASRLLAALREVIRRAMKVDADSLRFPRHWLFHVRWNRKKETVTARGGIVRFLTVGGRTTAWGPAVQGKWGPGGGMRRP